MYSSNAPYSVLEFFGGETVFEGLAAIDGDDGNLKPVAFVSHGILLYIDLFKCVLVRDSGGKHLRLGLFAEMAAGPGVERDVRFCVHGLSERRKERCP